MNPKLTLAEVVQTNPLALVSQMELAALHRCDVRSVRRMVERKELPAPAKMGKKRVWTAGKIQNYIDAKQDEQTAKVQRESNRILSLKGC